MSFLNLPPPPPKVLDLFDRRTGVIVRRAPFRVIFGCACRAKCSQHTRPTRLIQDLETLLWAICRLEHRADELVAEMAKEVGRPWGLFRHGGGGDLLLRWEISPVCCSVGRKDAWLRQPKKLQNACITQHKHESQTHYFKTESGCLAMYVCMYACKKYVSYVPRGQLGMHSHFPS